MVKFYPDQQKGHVLVLYELRRWQIFNFQNELLPDPEKEQPHICNFPKLLLVLFLYIKASSLLQIRDLFIYNFKTAIPERNNTMYVHVGHK